MASSDVRRRVLDEHAELRVILVAVEDLAHRVAKGEAESVGLLRERGLELHERLCDHLDVEDRHLLPAVERSGRFGAERAGRLRHEHAEQRALLEYILDRLRDLTRPSLILARELQNLAELLRDDMAYEESTLLASLVSEED